MWHGLAVWDERGQILDKNRKNVLARLCSQEVIVMGSKNSYQETIIHSFI